MEGTRQKVAITILLLTSLSGCLYYGKAVSRPPTALPTSNANPVYFDYPKEPLSPQVLSTSDRGDYVVQKLRFPTYTAFLYLPKGLTRAPAVVILPITNGNYPTKQMAHFMASRGFICLRLDSRGEQFAKIQDGNNPIENFEQFLKDYVADVLRAVDWLMEHPAVDRERIGVVGISLGGIVASIVTGVDARIKSGVFMLAGGDLTGILFSTKEPPLIAVRKRMEDQEDLTKEELRREVEDRFRNLDPLVYANRIDPSKVLMINAYFDRVIKRKHTMALWKAMGKPPMVLLPTGHYSAILFLNYAQRQALAHFQNVLGGPG
jgi:dienelactone hydrolase